MPAAPIRGTSGISSGSPSAVRSSRTSCTTSAPSSGRVSTRFFTANVPTQFYPTLAGAFEGGSFTNIAFVRGDYQMNSKQNLFYRYVNQHTEFFCSGCGGTNSSFSQLDNLIPRDMHAIGHTWVLSNRDAERVLLHARDRLGSQLPEQGLHAGGRAEQCRSRCRSRSVPASTSAPLQYRFPSVIWGNNQCLWPCRTGTMTTFTEAQETLTISSRRHNWKIGGSIQFFPTHEWAASNPGTWTFGRDQFFDPLNPNFNCQLADRRRRSSRRRSRTCTATSSTTPTRRTCPTSGSRCRASRSTWACGTTSRPASGTRITRRRNIRGRCRTSISRRAATRTTSGHGPASHGTCSRTGAPSCAAATASCYTNDHQRHAGQRDYGAQAEQHHHQQPDAIRIPTRDATRRRSPRPRRRTSTS